VAPLIAADARKKGMRAMVTLTYSFVSLAISFSLGIFGFFVGRCARKLPVIDDKLPWAIHRSQIPAAARPACEAESHWQA
jgi:hypothetical protein